MGSLGYGALIVAVWMTSWSEGFVLTILNLLEVDCELERERELGGVCKGWMRWSSEYVDKSPIYLCAQFFERSMVWTFLF